MKVVVLLGLVSCGVHKAETEALNNPSDATAWEKVGDAYRHSLRRERADDAYRTALQLDPSRTDLQERMSGGLSPQAREMQRMAMRSPTDDEVWGDLGDVLSMDGNLLEARAAYLRAFRIDPSDSEWQGRLAELGDGDLVTQMMSSQVDESDDESLGDYGDMLDSVGQTEAACDAWRRAAELDPDDDEWIRHASDCGYPVPEGWEATQDSGGYGVIGSMQDLYGQLGYNTVGSTVPEATDLESLVQRVNSDSGLLVRLGQAYLMAGDRPKATETLWGALLVAPTDEEALQTYLVATSKTRREVLETLRNTFTDNDEVVGLLADHYLDLGLRDRARDLYDLAHTLDAEDPEWESKRKLLGAGR